MHARALSIGVLSLLLASASTAAWAGGGGGGEAAAATVASAVAVPQEAAGADPCERHRGPDRAACQSLLKVLREIMGVSYVFSRVSDQPDPARISLGATRLMRLPELSAR